MTKITEVWKSIPGLPRYEASTEGRIRYIDGYILSPIPHNNKYLVVNFTHPKRQQHLVHRLIARTFIENPLNKCDVNHIDFNRHNNKLLNLEWVTRQENKTHSCRFERDGRVVINKETGIFYHTVKEALESLDDRHRAKVTASQWFRHIAGKLTTECILSFADQDSINKLPKINRTTLPKYTFQQIDKDGNLVAEYSKYREICKQFNISSTFSIQQAIKNPNRQAYGFKWRKLSAAERRDKKLLI